MFFQPVAAVPYVQENRKKNCYMREKRKRGKKRRKVQSNVLLGIERSLGRGVVNLDTTTLLLIAVGHGKSPATFVLGGSEPETEEMTTGSRRSEVCLQQQC